MGIEILTSNILTTSKKVCMESLFLQSVDRVYLNKKKRSSASVILLDGSEKKTVCISYKASFKLYLFFSWKNNYRSYLAY